MSPDITGQQVTGVLQELGTMHGHRGIRFNFTTLKGTQHSVTFDFCGNGAQFNGATYARCEAAALKAMISAGHSIDTWTHFLIG